ncbi:MAG: tRNA pseudouridine(55) synthase TruB [Firmicutes bacterium]|nr:tRNA pseudouridine(55) synthase TruB [Bacillota bacterium]
MTNKINGIIVLDKPKGKTSHDMVYFMRRLTGIKKIGHTGTLDPDATGVLPMCIGNATRAADMLTLSDKRYRAKFVLGITTDTQDTSGSVIEKRAVNASDAEITDAINSFVGEYEQIPPMYSAVKQNGKKLYELARAGKTVERKARLVNIKSIDIIKVGAECEIDVLCSKGTYIRTLCADIGEKLGCGAAVSELRRTMTGAFSTDESYTCSELERLAAEERLSDAVISVDMMFPDYEQIRLTENQTRSVCNGVIMTYHKPDGLYRVYDNNGRFICIGRIKDEKIKTEKSFWM